MFCLHRIHISKLRQNPPSSRLRLPNFQNTPVPSTLSIIRPRHISIGIFAVTAGSSAHYLVGSQILTPGSFAITRSGIVCSMPSSATAIAIGPWKRSVTRQASSPTPGVTVGCLTLAANSSFQYQNVFQTLAPGSAIIPAGQVIFLGSSARSVFIDGQTLNSSTPTVLQPQSLPYAALK